MGPLTWTDGGLATTLQRHGLPAGTGVEGWLPDKAAAIASIHRAFADAGAGIVLAATFRSLPTVEPRWAWSIDHAVTLAREAVGDRADVWAPLGPWSSVERRWSDLAARERPRIAEGWVAAASRAVRVGAKGIVLETFVDPTEALAAIRAIRAALPDAALVASLVPRPDGALADGTDPRGPIEAIAAAGATGAGFNCGWDPSGVERALDRCEGLPVAWWAKPAAGTASQGEVVDALLRLAGRCTWVGGCCGVPPEVLAAAITAARPGGGAVPYSNA